MGCQPADRDAKHEGGTDGGVRMFGQDFVCAFGGVAQVFGQCLKRGHVLFELGPDSGLLRAGPGGLSPAARPENMQPPRKVPSSAL